MVLRDALYAHEDGRDLENEVPMTNTWEEGSKLEYILLLDKFFTRAAMWKKLSTFYYRFFNADDNFKSNLPSLTEEVDEAFVRISGDARYKTLPSKLYAYWNASQREWQGILESLLSPRDLERPEAVGNLDQDQNKNDADNLIDDDSSSYALTPIEAALHLMISHSEHLQILEAVSAALETEQHQNVNREVAQGWIDAKKNVQESEEQVFNAYKMQSDPLFDNGIKAPLRGYLHSTGGFDYTQLWESPCFLTRVLETPYGQSLLSLKQCEKKLQRRFDANSTKAEQLVEDAKAITKDAPAEITQILPEILRDIATIVQRIGLAAFVADLADPQFTGDAEQSINNESVALFTQRGQKKQTTKKTPDCLLFSIFGNRWKAQLKKITECLEKTTAPKAIIILHNASVSRQKVLADQFDQLDALQSFSKQGHLFFTFSVTDDVEIRCDRLPVLSPPEQDHHLAGPKRSEQPNHPKPDRLRGGKLPEKDE